MSPSQDPKRRAVALARVQVAMRKIETAQGLLGEACAALSPVCYGNPAQVRVGKLYDRVHAEWYRVRKLLDDPRIELDHDPRPGDEEGR
jgi:hypothetical protein